MSDDQHMPPEENCPDCGHFIDVVGDCGCDDDYAEARRAERARAAQ